MQRRLGKEEICLGKQRALFRAAEPKLKGDMNFACSELNSKEAEKAQKQWLV